MKTVAPHDRPREKLQRLGASALGDNELVAIVLGHGQPRASALDLANAVLVAVDGVDGLSRARPDDLTRIAGIGPARAAQVLAAVELGRRTLTRVGRERVQLKTPRGTAELLLKRDPATIRNAVASPGGATEAGLAHLEGVVEDAFANAINASLERVR